MFESSQSTIARAAIGKRCNPNIGSATDCILAARGIWPSKTAECWAAESGVQPRMVKYWLAGTHKVSDSGKIALIRRIAAG